jgi:hypothetical protein
MPASKSAIRTNINRIRGAEEGYTEVPEIKALLDEVLTEIPEADDNLPEIWGELIDRADAKHIADKIPGTVGRMYKVAYGKTKPRPPKVKLRIKVTDSARRYMLEFTEVVQNNGSDEIWDGINKLIHPTAVMRGTSVAVLSPYAFKKALRRSLGQFDTDKDRAWARQIIDGIIRRVEHAEDVDAAESEDVYRVG